MARLRNKIAVLALVLVLCLASLGATYAYWSDSLTIDGTVNTGSVAVQFNNCKSNDAEIPGENDPKEPGVWSFGSIHDPDTWTWSGARFEWNEAITESEIGQDAGDSPNSALTITMAGGYPKYNAHVAFSIGNVGTVPVAVEVIRVTQVSKAAIVVPVSVDLVAGETWYVYFDSGGVPHISDSLQYDAGIVISEFSLTLSHLALGDYIAPGDAIPGDLCYRVEAGASSGTTYDFLIEIMASQYNEVVVS